MCDKQRTKQNTLRVLSSALSYHGSQSSLTAATLIMLSSSLSSHRGITPTVYTAVSTFVAQFPHFLQYVPSQYMKTNQSWNKRDELKTNLIHNNNYGLKRRRRHDGERMRGEGDERKSREGVCCYYGKGTEIDDNGRRWVEDHGDERRERGLKL